MNEHAMEGEGDNKWKFTKTAILSSSGRITLKNCLPEYFHSCKSPDFRLQVLRCTGSYSQVFTVFVDSYKQTTIR